MSDRIDTDEARAGSVAPQGGAGGGGRGGGGGGAGRFSTWALAAFICSVACCPVATALGILLGARALLEIRAKPHVRGRRLAVAAIVIGSIVTLGWGTGALWWHHNIRQPMQAGPRAELRAGLAGDVAGFRDGFSTEASQAEASGFLNELTSRYGRLLDITQPPDAPDAVATPMTAGPAVFRIRYILHFEGGDVEAEAEFATFAQRRVIPQPICKWSWLRVIDPEAGDLMYPPGTKTQAAAVP